MSLIVAKIGLVGNSGIGKTSFMNNIMGVNNSFLQPTIGVDFNIKPFVYKKDKNSLNINWNVYDTAGQERFSPIIRTYYRLCNIIILGFSDEESYNNLDYWLDQIKDYNDKCKIFLVRYKIDLDKIDLDKIDLYQTETTRSNLIKKFGKIYDISVKKNKGTEILINDINEYIYSNQDKMIRRENIDIEKNNLKSKCC
jgi:small GTP-binding protein